MRIWRNMAWNLADVPSKTKANSSKWAIKKSHCTHPARVNARGFMQGVTYNYGKIFSRLPSKLSFACSCAIFYLQVEANICKSNFPVRKVQERTDHIDEGTWRISTILLNLCFANFLQAQASRKIGADSRTEMGYKQTLADPFLCYSWTTSGLVVWIT